MRNKVYFDRVDDLLDDYWFRRISRDEFIKMLEELNFDTFDARTEANMIDEAKDYANETL